MRRSAGDMGSRVTLRLDWITRLATLAARSRNELSRAPPVAFYIKDDPYIFAKLLPDDEIDQELKGLEGHAAAANQEARVIAAEVDDGTARFRVVSSSQGPADVHLGGPQDFAEGLVGQSRGAATLGNSGNSDRGQARPQCRGNRTFPYLVLRPRPRRGRRLAL